VPPPGKEGGDKVSYELFLPINTPVLSLPPRFLWGDKHR